MNRAVRRAGAAAAMLMAIAAAAQEAARAKVPAGRPALSVAAVVAERASLPLTLAANGSIAAWQEASIGAEAPGWRLAEVRVNVGDVVRKGQLLATFAAEMPRADLAHARAAVAEGEAMLAEATANAQRARDLQSSGAWSAQQITQVLTAERTAAARLDALRAALQVQLLRVAMTQVLAPDDGVISARMATVGAVAGAGQELFRLIRGGRLEWRAEVAATDLAAIKPGSAVRVLPAGASPLAGRVRRVAPTVDPATRNGLVYVDLIAPGGAKAGMFARGEFELGASAALTLPHAAVLARDGFAWVFKLGADSRVALAKVSTGRRSGERVEIVGGLAEGESVVASGGGFLADGDLVRVVGGAPAGKR
jgi:RND family efflux transporter MFP subunit